MLGLNLNLKNNIMKNQKFYIGERTNPQLAKSYYMAYGQLTKKEASKKENCNYAEIYLTSFDTKEEYDEAKKKLQNDGFLVSNNEKN